MKYYVLTITYTDLLTDYIYEYNVGVFDDESTALFMGQKLREEKFKDNYTFDYWTNVFVLNETIHI
jgi:hypothetical protein